MATPQLVVILGMHRSGTSCLAGALERCGLYLGDVRRTGRFNAKGYFERPDVVKIHDQILGLNRASWHQPPQEPVQLHPFHRQQLLEIAQSLTSKSSGGFKDPRTLLLLDHWENLAPTPCVLVGTFRHPLAVARSLMHRNSLRESHALELWIHCNAILMARHQRRPFPLIEYDMQDKSSYLQDIAQIAHRLGLSPKLRKLQRFVNHKLAHYHFTPDQVPHSCRPIYEYLMNANSLFRP